MNSSSPNSQFPTMAGIFAAKAPPTISIFAPFSLLKPRGRSVLPFVYLYAPDPFLNSTRRCSRMTIQNREKSSEPEEPLPTLQKVRQNGATEESTAPTPFLKVKKLSENAVLPARSSALAAGYDLSSAKEIKVPARGKALIPTDLSFSIPEETYARIAPRSGLAWKHSIDVGAGVIDADYRGPVSVILFNHSDVDFEVKRGDRIAQLIVERIMTPHVLEVEDLNFTVRGAGGFGSTGV